MRVHSATTHTKWLSSEEDETSKPSLHTATHVPLRCFGGK
jgi:hypothetical protein